MSKRTIILSLCAALLAVGLCLFVGMQVAVDRANSQMQDRLLLARQTVLSYLATYEQLPSVLALDSRVISLLDPLATPEEANRVSEYLEDVRARTAASEIFLMNGNGLTLAASNHDSVLSFVGRNYQFRPYFMDALQTGSGGMFAIGATTGVPGYFMAQRIRTTGYREGVIVVKVDLQRIVERWQSASEDYFISDSDSIVFLATEQSDIYRPIQPLEHSALFRLQASRSYEQVSSNFQRPLVTQVLPENTNWFWSNDGRVVGMLPLGVNGWNIHTSTSLLQLVMFVSAIAALLSFSLALLAAGAVIFRQQRKYAQLQLEQTRELEQKVDERTHLLRNEIEDRKRAEKRLRKTQNQLIEAAKLAALGKMSATIAHEVSQPLAALNTTLASARLHADRNQTEALENKLSAAQNMTGRLHRMLKHLKSFARRSAPKAGNVNVNDTIDAALAVLEPKIKAVDVAIARDVDAKLKVFADDLQLQQVLVNVIANAIDATQERETRLVTIKATKASATIILSVHDTGKGINLDHQADPFEPFQTTKVTGEGLGLGLAITREIVERHGGHISLANHPHGGAIVSISLPAARLSSEVEPELA